MSIKIAKDGTSSLSSLGKYYEEVKNLRGVYPYGEAIDAIIEMRLYHIPEREQAEKNIREEWEREKAKWEDEQS